MKKRIERFISKKGISQKNILYILRNESKTCIHMTNGQVITTYFSMKNILSVLNSEDIICINKGVSVSKAGIASVKNGIYTMLDGTEFKGRVRTPGEHKKNSAIVSAMNTDSSEITDITPANIARRFSVMDKCPLPIGVVELVFDDVGNPADMIFCYLNDRMAELAESTVTDSGGRSFYDVFDVDDKKWLEINAEVARSGRSCSVKSHIAETGRDLSLYYFSPASGYSACVII